MIDIRVEDSRCRGERGSSKGDTGVSGLKEFGDREAVNLCRSARCLEFFADQEQSDVTQSPIPKHSEPRKRKLSDAKENGINALNCTLVMGGH